LVEALLVARTLSGAQAHAILAAMMVLFAVMGVNIAWNKSATADEVPHIGAGLAYLHYGDFRMNPEHPNLVKLAAALPLYLIDPPDMTVEWPEEDSRFRWWFEGAQHRWGHYLLFRQDDHHQWRLVLARLAPIAFGLLGGWLAFLWGREVGGRAESGLAAAALLLFYPEYLGHAAYVTFDVPMVAACAAVSWVAFRWWRSPDMRRVIAFAIVAGLASQVKLPASVFIAFTLITLVILCRFSGGRVGHRHWSILFVATFVAAFLACWAGAFFRFSLLPTGADLWRPLDYGVPVTRTPLSGWDQLANALWETRLLPEATLSTLAHMGSMQGRLVTFFGERTGGTIPYFFVTFLIKTPLPIIAALVVALIVQVRKGRRRASLTQAWRLQRACILLMPFVALFLLVVIGRVNIGHRHVLFIYFPLSVFLGALAINWITRGNRAQQGAAAFLLLSQLATAIWTHPHQATYINAAFGDTYRVHHIINDSNIDWGGDLPLLAQWMRDNDVTLINLSYFGSSRPESYGINDTIAILPDWGQAIDMPERENPDLTRPTAVSLFTLQWVRDAYPGLYDREPDIVLNSIVVFLPVHRNNATDAP
jgi:hypothetical protein